MDPSQYFEQTIAKNQVELSRLKKLSLTLSMLRLVIFLAIIFLVYFFWGNTAVVSITAIVGLGGFLFLVARYADVKLKRDYHQKLKDLNESELQALAGDFSNYIPGTEYLDEHHHYNQDIDLFGQGSLFQLVNRTGTENGRRLLADKLNSNDTTNIEAKQNAIKELASYPDWRQHFEVTASLIQSEVETFRIIKWMQSYVDVIPKIFRFVPFTYSVISLAVIGLYGFSLIPGNFIVYDFVLGLAISGLFLKKINTLYQDAGKMKETFAQYGKLIKAIEDRECEASELKKIKELLVTNGKDASEVLAQLSKEINNLDQRNNIFFGFLANGFLLWDLRYSYRIEKWMNDNETSIEQWFEAVAAFDAMNSFGNFAFVRPAYFYPLQSEDSTILKADNLGHPLLDEKKRIDNSIHISDGDFFIITGANMAGKSTFLRTVALNLVMANCGLPVCAEAFSFRPIKLISSMRTSDSLQNDESYFFSELKRLKFIVDEINSDSYFIILDEILKGTNSKDKAEGSQKFVERLVRSKSTGLIATHDLSLCKISEHLPQVKNHYFDAQIVDDELYFDYTFKDGICENMNASFLLKKMDIV